MNTEYLARLLTFVFLFLTELFVFIINLLMINIIGIILGDTISLVWKNNNNIGKNDPENTTENCAIQLN